MEKIKMYIYSKSCDKVYLPIGSYPDVIKEYGYCVLVIDGQTYHLTIKQ